MRGSSSCIFLSYSSFKPKQRQSSDSKLQCFVGLYFMRSSRCSTQAVSFILLMKRISILTSLNCSRWVLKTLCQHLGYETPSFQKFPKAAGDLRSLKTPHKSDCRGASYQQRSRLDCEKSQGRPGRTGNKGPLSNGKGAYFGRAQRGSTLN